MANLRNMKWVDENEVTNLDVASYLNKKEKPYSPNNTVVYFGILTTYIGKGRNDVDKATYSFVKIARTFSKWDEEVKVYFGKELSEVSYSISDNIVLIPISSKDKDNKEKWRYVDLMTDICSFKLNELKEIQELNNKEKILESKKISYINKLLLYRLWKSGSKLIIPTDLLYHSLYNITLKSCGFGTPIFWDSAIMQEMIGFKKEGNIKVIHPTEIKNYNYQEKDFDYYSTTLYIEGNKQVFNRKQIASYFRQKTIIFK